MVDFVRAKLGRKRRPLAGSGTDHPGGTVDATGIIFAGLDCDADCIEAWNRWYDLEHLPPNIALPGIMTGRRYVAPPALHAVRIVNPESGFARSQGTFVTVYTLCDDPQKVFDGMVTLRDKLDPPGRMFASEKKIVREGDVLSLAWVDADPVLKADPEDVAHIGHTGLVVVERRCAAPVRQWYRSDWAAKALAVDGVHAIVSHASINRPGLDLDLILIEGDPVKVTLRLRAAVPHHPDADIVLDAPFSLIDTLRYPWAHDIRSSDLPQTVAGS